MENITFLDHLSNRLCALARVLIDLSYEIEKEYSNQPNYSKPIDVNLYVQAVKHPINVVKSKKPLKKGKKNDSTNI